MKKKAFTLAETLATLGVIGIVAALLIPSVIVNYNNHVFKTSKEVLKTTLSDSVRIMAATESRLNNAKKYTDDEEEDNNRSANEVFIQDHFTKYIKFAKVCDPDTAEGIYACGWREGNSYKDMFSAKQFAIPTKNDDIGFKNDDKMWSAITANGMSLLIAYNPDCMSFNNATFGPKPQQLEESSGFYPHETACMNILYDVNGVSSPNTFGKDVGFATVFYPRTAKIGLPIFVKNAELVSEMSDFKSAEDYCASLPLKEGAILPNREEASSIYLNSKYLFDKEKTKVWFSNAIDGKSNGYKANNAICVTK